MVYAAISQYFPNNKPSIVKMSAVISRQEPRWCFPPEWPHNPRWQWFRNWWTTLSSRFDSPRNSRLNAFWSVISQHAWMRKTFPEVLCRARKSASCRCFIYIEHWVKVNLP